MTTNRLRTAREAVGLEQPELAAAAKVSQPTISRIESGLQTPSVHIAIRLASVLSTTVEDLFGQDVSSEPPPTEPEAA